MVNCWAGRQVDIMGWADPAPEPVPGQHQVHTFNYVNNVQKGKQMESLIMWLLSLLFSNRKKLYLCLWQPFLLSPACTKTFRSLPAFSAESGLSHYRLFLVKTDSSCHHFAVSCRHIFKEKVFFKNEPSFEWKRQKLLRAWSLKTFRK